MSRKLAPRERPLETFNLNTSQGRSKARKHGYDIPKRPRHKRQPRPFWDWVEKTETCWTWTGAKNDEGYGQYTAHCQEWRAHRYAYALVVGPIPDGMRILHRCDNPSCVRPDHLFLGTDQDNSDDKRRKGRHPHGEGVWNAKLTADKVLELRALAGTASLKELGDRFAIRPGYACDIIHGRKGWQHIRAGIREGRR